jgi:hypothetical protein
VAEHAGDPFNWDARNCHPSSVGVSQDVRRDLGDAGPSRSRLYTIPRARDRVPRI